jgi:hypothetical protein
MAQAGQEEGAAEGGVGVGGFLVGEEAVAPGLEELGVEVGACGWLRGLFGGGEFGVGERGGCGGGELQHLAAGVTEFGHRGNLRTIVWIPNFGMRCGRGKGKNRARNKSEGKSRFSPAKDYNKKQKQIPSG